MNQRVLRRGVVVDQNGQPVEGALVSVVWGTAPTPEIARRTDANGGFHVALPPGDFRLRAVTSDGRAAQLDVKGDAEEPIVLRLHKSVEEPG